MNMFNVSFSKSLFAHCTQLYELVTLQYFTKTLLLLVYILGLYTDFILFKSFAQIEASASLTL